MKKYILIIGIIFVLGIGLYFYTQNTSNQVQPEQISPTPAVQRHDNSGAGTNPQEDTSIQGHMQHALQHIGL
jgi:hypothetical protein